MLDTGSSFFIAMAVCYTLAWEWDFAILYVSFVWWSYYGIQVLDTGQLSL